MANLKELCEEVVGLKDIAVIIKSADGGESAQTIAKYANKIYCIHDWQDTTEEAFDLNTNHYENVIKVKGSAGDVAGVFADRVFHFMYLHNCTPRDIEVWWPKLRQGGYFAGDQYANVDGTVKKYFGTPDDVLEDTWVVRKQPGRMKWRDTQAACAASSSHPS